MSKIAIRAGDSSWVPADKLSDFWWLLRYGMGAVGKFLTLVQNRFVATGDVVVHFQELGTISSTGQYSVWERGFYMMGVGAFFVHYFEY